MRKAVRAIVLKGTDLLVMKRNKFGQEYYTLVGGGIDFGETAEQSLVREIQEETTLSVTNPRLVFIDEAGDPWGTQYVYACEYTGGDPALHPESEEAKLNTLGQNIHEPVWLPLDKLADVPFRSERLKAALLRTLPDALPGSPETLA